MSKSYIDLHLHTLFSDGVSTPEEVAKEAHNMDLAAIALTDHDTTEGCQRQAKACAKYGIEFIPGTELSTDIQGHEMHLLGYFLDTDNQELIQEALNLGCLKAKVITTKTICLAHWLKTQCQFGCPYFGSRLTCPPFTPNLEEVSELLLEYQKAILIEAPDSNKVREIVVSLEDSLKSKGFYKAFGLCATVCNLCEECTIETHCKHPTQARPFHLRLDVLRQVSHHGDQDHRSRRAGNSRRPSPARRPGAGLPPASAPQPRGSRTRRSSRRSPRRSRSR